MKKLTQFLVAAAMVVGGSALAQQTTSTQTVTTNVTSSMSISLTDGTNTAVTALTTALANNAAGATSSAGITLNLKSTDTTGFHVSAKTDNTNGKMCAYDTTNGIYVTNGACLVNPVNIASSTATGFTGTPTLHGTASALSSTDTKIVSSSETVSNATVTSTLSQLFDWQDQVLSGGNLYEVQVTYTIASGV